MEGMRINYLEVVFTRQISRLFYDSVAYIFY